MYEIIFYIKILSGGFTLIELLVVIAIISLLSSVILASLKDARDKAKMSAFRQEVYQFINALELYRVDNGSYPAGTFRLGTSNIIDFDSASFIPKYIQRLPKPISDNDDPYFRYYSQGHNNYVYLCKGDTVAPGYIIRIYDNSGGGYDKAFPDWKVGYGLGGTFSEAQTSSLDPNNAYKCFSVQ
jgi:type II secretion system protein G